jgi:hypothetical protein
MTNYQNIILKIISIGFLLHVLNLFILYISAEGYGRIYLLFGSASLMVIILLWISPRIGVYFGLIRSVIGITWAIFLKHFLNFGLLKDSMGIYILWPSIFFLIASVFFLYFIFRGSFSQENTNTSSNLLKIIIFTVIGILLLVIGIFTYSVFTTDFSGIN